MRSTKKYSIGVFDSGFGGLDILKNIVKELPQYNYIYLSDTARAPYGTRSQELIYSFTKQAVDFLFKNNCQLIILACNTASSQALRQIQQKYLPKNYPQKRVLGVIIPVTEIAIQKTFNHRIGVMATQASVNSRSFEKELKKLNPQVKVFQKSCPLLVPIIEAGEQNLKTTQLVLENYLKPLIKNQIDTLILGCTHYGYLKNKIRKIIGNKVNIISEGKIVAQKLKDYLLRHPEIEKTLSQNSKVNFLTTDLTDNFKILGTKYFGQKIKPKKISLS